MLTETPGTPRLGSESEWESDAGVGDASDFTEYDAKPAVPPCAKATSLKRSAPHKPSERWMAVADGLKLRIFNAAAPAAAADVRDSVVPCAHLGKLAATPLVLDIAAARGLACVDCRSSGENWLCLTCHQTFCSRFVRGHMFKHGLRHQHPISMSLNDKSIWCYECDRYLSEFVDPALMKIVTSVTLI